MDDQDTLCSRMARAARASTTFSIWPGGDAPGAQTSPVSLFLENDHTGNSAFDRAVTGVRAPEITVYRPEKPNGIGILVTPGGSYKRVVLDKEGTALAPDFTARGYTLFVMTYRLPGDGHTEGANAPLADVQRAMRTVRHQADKWQVNVQKIGVLGFSSGGHVAASLGTRYEEPVYPCMDTIDAISSRPDFMALVYPVISMDERFGHAGSRMELIGAQPESAQREHYSLDKRVGHNTPPTFLLHAVDDPAVKVENSLAMFNALHAHQVPVEMHLFEQGRHGFGIRDAQGLPVAEWPRLLMSWIETKM
ncbi:MAG: alpha/beta hydrolase [Kluyvera intermedia]